MNAKQRGMFAIPAPDVYVKCGSHRARDRLQSLLGRKLQCYYDFNRRATGGYFLIPAARLDEARKIPGVSRAKHPDDLAMCWPLIVPSRRL